MNHVNAAVAVREFGKEGWQAALYGSKVLQAELFRNFSLLRFENIMQRLKIT